MFEGIKFVLTARGNIIQPMLNVVLTHAQDAATAKEEGAKIAIELYEAGYFMFDIYEIETNMPVCEVYVNHPKPTVEFK